MTKPSATMKNYMVLTILGADHPGILNEITSVARNCGCNLKSGNIAILGKEFSASFLVEGGWSQVAKMEANLPALEQRLGVTTMVRRTHEAECAVPLMTYSLSIVTRDNPGLLNQICEFFNQEHLNLQDCTIETYTDNRTRQSMANLTLHVHVPFDTHIGTLRERFIEFCDDNNLDAVFEPIRD